MRVPRIETLSPKELLRVTKRQREQQRASKAAGTERQVISCRGLDFSVHASVFPPRHDTALLIASMPATDGLSVLDLGTGCGAIAVHAARQGARLVLALDINPAAIANAAENVQRHDLSHLVECRVSDVFDAVPREARFDLVAANLPGRSLEAPDLTAQAQWDTGFRTHRHFFSEVRKFLTPEGRIVMTKANYPEINDALQLAQNASFAVEILARAPMIGDDPRVYYALQFRAAWDHG